MTVQTQYLSSTTPAGDANPLALVFSGRVTPTWRSLLNGRVRLGLTRVALHIDWAGASKPQWQSPNTHGITVDPNQVPWAWRLQLGDSGRSPQWIARAEQPLAVLSGEWQDLELGIVHAPDHASAHNPEDTWQAQVWAAIALADLHILETEKLWTHTIHPNQHAVLERKIAKTLWEQGWSSSLSWGTLAHPSATATPSATAPTPPSLLSSASESTLAACITDILQADPQDFAALVERAELDWYHDFSGGNLLGVILDGVDWSGANLIHANLRGAELCDVDLSDALLTEAKLGGADLSGAYLSNTDLRGADLHRASLALVNLSGADLRGANLRETNLSHTNFHGAEVAGATFADNPGLLPETIELLRDEGAVLL